MVLIVGAMPYTVTQPPESWHVAPAASGAHARFSNLPSYCDKFYERFSQHAPTNSNLEG